jgi:hypothetical protein
VWFAYNNVLLHALFYHDFKYVNAVPFCSEAVELLSNTLFLLIVTKLLQWVDCSFPNPDTCNATTTVFTSETVSGETFEYYQGCKATLDVDPDIICWEGDHVWKGVLALVLLVVYPLSASTTGTFFIENPDPAVDVRWKETFIVQERLLKFIVLILNSFFGANYATIGLGANMICFGFLAAQLLRTPTQDHSTVCTYDLPGVPCQTGERPCSIVFLNYVKGFFYLLSFIACGVGIVAATLINNPEETYAHLYVLVGICATLGVVAARVAFISNRNGDLDLCEREEEEEEVDDDGESIPVVMLTILGTIAVSTALSFVPR